MGKHVCIHTHFNHPNEITWVTKRAAKYLFKNNVIVRNQSVLLKGVNDNVETMGKLIRELADMNYQPVSPSRPSMSAIAFLASPYLRLQPLLITNLH
jgi:L-lysine 2,3-aminomutase